MKTDLLFTSILAALIVPIFAASAQVAGQNLISNPSCEDSAKNNKIPSWVEVSGFDWQRQLGSVDYAPPCDGQYIFSPGAKDSAELRQDINVSKFNSSIDAGGQYFVFRGYVRSYQQSPPDSCRIVLEYRVDTISAPLRLFDTHNLCNTSAWQLVRDSALAPKGARIIRIRLISTRFNGADNDGYYDALSLVAAGVSLGVKSGDDLSPKGFSLDQNYPNPFNPTTTFQFSIGNLQFVELKIFDLLGREVATLVNEKRPSGNYSVKWDASSFPSGIYFCRLKAGSFVETKKLILMK